MEKKVVVEISARHVHLSQEDYKKLFGADAEMVAVKNLTGGGAFVDAKRVTLVGPKGEMSKVAILGPYRPTQIELAKTDARKLGIDAPVRLSGDIAGSGAVKIIGEVGEVDAAEGAIVAKRHVHIGESDAAAWGVKKNDVVMVKITTDDRTTIYDDVIIRTNPDDGLPPLMHIDTDEGNAAGMNGTMEAVIYE
ncbi:MAG: phosphate propanoyltransferase [Clostridiales bacterium]|nr:phosphate propanoyltransferase [Candidatus Crickella caballi]